MPDYRMNKEEPITKTTAQDPTCGMAGGAFHGRAKQEIPYVEEEEEEEVKPKNTAPFEIVMPTLKIKSKAKLEDVIQKKEVKPLKDIVVKKYEIGETKTPEYRMEVETEKIEVEDDEKF